MTDFVSVLKKKHGFRYMEAALQNDVRNAEEILGVQFSKEYKDYLLTFGVAVYFGHELTGICASPRLNVVSVTQEARKNDETIPADWYVVEDINIDGVLIWQNTAGEVHQTVPGLKPEKIAGSLSEYVQRDL